PPHYSTLPLHAALPILSRRARGVRHALLGPLARWLARRDDRVARPSVVHRMPIPPRAQVAADAPAPAVRGLRRCGPRPPQAPARSEEHTSELQSRGQLV